MTAAHDFETVLRRDDGHAECFAEAACRHQSCSACTHGRCGTGRGRSPDLPERLGKAASARKATALAVITGVVLALS